MSSYVSLASFLEPQMQGELLAWATTNEALFSPSKVAAGKGVVDPTRRVSMLLREVGPFTAPFRAKMLSVGPQLMQQLGMAPFEIVDVELEVVANNDGAFFASHLDTFVHEAEATKERRISAVYYFHREPKAFAGGALRFHPIFKPEGAPEHVDVEPVNNSLLAFASWLPHEVRLVSCPSRRFADSRFTVNAWLYAERLR